MGIIGTIFIGLIVGLLARFLKPGDDSMGWIMTSCWVSAVRWQPPMAAKRWVSTRRAKVPALLVPWSVP